MVIETAEFLEEYFFIFLFVFFAIIVSVVPVLLAFLRSKSNPYEDKCSPYECGFDPISPTSNCFDVRFYLVAILFVIFDLEIVFLFPWAAAFQNMGVSGVISMLLFLGVLGAGFVYEWKKGALDWA